jgi:putative ABC transport system substrate-binding protein
MLLLRSTLIILVYLLLGTPAYGKDDTVAVIYPRVSEPYNQVFSAIIDGIKSEFDSQAVTLKALEKSDDNQSFSTWLNNENPEMIIALGKRGYQYAKNLTKPEAIVIGALPIKPNGISGVSLLGDPKVLFESLQLLAPQIKQVNVVYSKNSEWLINLAEDHSQNMGLVFKKIKVDSIKDAASEYEKLLNNLDAKTDAIWLPLDPLTANEQVILPNLLEKSWQQNFVLFSSKPAHTKRGALFSMFPNHFELGQQLAAMVEGIHTTRTKAGVVPLKSKHLAVNLRTANHLGFKYNNQQKKSFYLTFPN